MEAGGLSRIDPTFWQQLAAMPSRMESLGAKPLFPEVSTRVYGAVDGLKRRHVLVRLDATDPDVRDVRSRGLSIDTIVYGDDRGGAIRFADVVCLDAGGHEAFDLVATEVATLLPDESGPCADVIQRVIMKWRRFWNNNPSQLLSTTELAGLFAEVWCLRDWVLPFMDARSAVEAWRGPLGRRHDFEFQCGAIEVKATLRQDSIVHHVNGVHQLELPATGPLKLLSFSLAEEPSAADSLPELLASVSAKLRDAEAESMFLGRLIAMGYRDFDAPEYAKRRFRVRRQSLFVVEGDFPRIIPTTLHSGVPIGVSDIEYEIALDGFGHLVEATAPSADVIQRLRAAPLA
jgi:hypothetical protein